MATRSLRIITASLLAAPLLAFAGPPAGHGNGHGNGAAGEHGNGNGQASAQPSAQHAGNQDEPGGAAHAKGGHGSTDGQSGESGEDDAAGGGRANSQGAAHANYHAIQAVCSHPNAAAHSALGINCPGVVGSRDARTGTHVYTQPGMEMPTAPAATIRPRAGTIKPP